MRKVFYIFIIFILLVTVAVFKHNNSYNSFYIEVVLENKTGYVIKELKVKYNNETIKILNLKDKKSVKIKPESETSIVLITNDKKIELKSYVENGYFGKIKVIFYKDNIFVNSKICLPYDKDCMKDKKVIFKKSLNS